jgi:hypothetical protein
MYNPAMDSSGRITLRQAADLIRQGKRNQAQPLLVEFLRDEPNNAQGWYLLSHALTDPKRQQYAVLQALRADPTFERARNRLITLQGGTPPAAEAATLPVPKLDPVPPSSPNLAVAHKPKPKPVVEKTEPSPKPGAAFFDNDEPQTETTQELRAESIFQETDPQRPRRSFRGLLIGIILFVLLATAVYFGRDLVAGTITLVNPTATRVPARTLPPTWTSTATTERPTLTSTPVPTNTPAPSETPGPTQAITLQ